MPEPITNYDGRLEQMANYCETMLDNIAKVNNAYHNSVEDKYSVSLPAHLIKWKGINQIGGKTIVWNQLVDTGIAEVGTVSGHNYYTLINGTASIVTSDGTAISVVDDTADMICDLTLMFGSGNEPSTTADFTAIFGATHYEYNEGALLSAGVTEVVSKDSNNATLQTYSVPAEVQALEGYGWSAGSVYNYIDFERKVFVKRVGKYSNYVRNMNSPNNNYPGWEYPEVATLVGEGLNTEYANSVVATAPYAKNGGACTVNTKSGRSILMLIGTGLTQPEWKSTYPDLLVDVYLELATPQEIDISQYLTDDNLINVEAGGTITFPNQNGTDYQIPVPSEIEYIGLT